jgi:hypothetical protein
VSTEYLLGRTDVKRADASKRAAAEYLGLSEGAVDAIFSLRTGILEQDPLRDYKPEFVALPLTGVFGAWLEAVDLPKLTSALHRLLAATFEYDTSGLHPDKYGMGDDQKRAALLLRENGHVVLPLPEQLDYYRQVAEAEFRGSVERLTLATEMEKMEKQALTQRGFPV